MVKHSKGNWAHSIEVMSHAATSDGLKAPVCYGFVIMRPSKGNGVRLIALKGLNLSRGSLGIVPRFPLGFGACEAARRIKRPFSW